MSRIMDDGRHRHDPDPETGRCRTCRQPSTMYDGIATWYQELFLTKEFPALAEVVDLLRDLMPPMAPDILVDLACGPGLQSVSLVATGWKVIGVDASKPMTELAEPRLTEVINEPVDTTGLDPGAFPVVVSTLSHTDAPWGQVVAEAYRLLRPGGVFLYVGTHPCFVGPHAQHGMHGEVFMHPGLYGNGEHAGEAPGYTEDGIRRRVGARHLDLSDFLRPLLDPRWERMTVVEGDDLTRHIGVRVFRAPDQGDAA